MTLLPLIVPVALLVLCAASDAERFKIPNRYVALLLCAWPVTMALTGAGWHEVGLTAALAGVLFLAGFALFAFGALGGGDVKLLAAAALWAGASQMVLFLFATAALGGLLGILLLMFRARPLAVPMHRIGWIVSLHERERVMPYGIAISGGAIIAMARGAGAF